MRGKLENLSGGRLRSKRSENAPTLALPRGAGEGEEAWTQIFYGRKRCRSRSEETGVKANE